MIITNEYEFPAEQQFQQPVAPPELQGRRELIRVGLSADSGLTSARVALQSMYSVPYCVLSCRWNYPHEPTRAERHLTNSPLAKSSACWVRLRCWHIFSARLITNSNRQALLCLTNNPPTGIDAQLAWVGQDVVVFGLWSELISTSHSCKITSLYAVIYGSIRVRQCHRVRLESIF